MHVLIIHTTGLQNPHEISAVASSSFGVLLADIYGSIHILNPYFESVLTWIAFSGGRATHMFASKGTLITIGVCARLPSWLKVAHRIFQTGGRELLLSTIEDMGYQTGRSGFSFSADSQHKDTTWSTPSPRKSQ